ncbi:MAG TPA: dethiobiotin synthase [Ilumatobacter sp.]|nr:dethiobiotin synthase [Ilumatobacter sp.]
MGTATEIGKTWLSVQLVAELRARGHAVAVRKPVQSYEHPTNNDTDAELLAAASGEPVHTVCPAHRWYPEPMAPPMASAALGRDPIAAADLIDELAWPADATIGIVETVGGVRSPMAHDIDSAGFAHAIGATHVLLVADAGLGTINSVRLAKPTLDSIPTLVYLNRFAPNDLHRRNLDWLTHNDRFPTAVDITSVVDWIEDTTLS